MKRQSLIPLERMQLSILVIRSERVILDTEQGVPHMKQELVNLPAERIEKATT